MWAMLALFILYLAVLAAGVYEDGMNLFQFMAVFPDGVVPCKCSRKIPKIC